MLEFHPEIFTELLHVVPEKIPYCEKPQHSEYLQTEVFDRLRIPEGDPARNAITIANPLGEDFSIMRTLSVNGILTGLALNFNHRNKDVRLFEMGNVYIAQSLPLTELPDERMQMTLAFYGDGDFFDMKGVVEELLESVSLLSGSSIDRTSTIVIKPTTSPSSSATKVQ